MEMAKDGKTMNQMLRVLRYQMIPKNFTVFNFDSTGDLFYMVLSGNVLCKVPHDKQYIMLNDLELRLFKAEFMEDIISIKEANELNEKLKQYGPIKAQTAF